MAGGARIPSTTEINQLIVEWNEWLSARTDALLSLEDRVRSAGTAGDQADVAAAFVCRKAIADCVARIAALAATDRSGAAALATQPLVDDLGGPVGSNLTDAATLLDAVLQRVEHAVATREQQQAGEANARVATDADLTVAERLAAELGMQANQVAQLREAFAAGRDGEHVAAEAATVRASLEAASRERATLLQRWAGVGARLDELSAAEVRVRELAARCREKIVQAPPLAVPSVAAIELDGSDMSTLTWVAARGRITPLLARVDRLEAALTEAERRFQGALDRRDDLRGLLQSFADKASAGGVMELPDLDALYQEAKAVLWAAPCDLSRAAELVDRYVTLVNTKMKEGAR
jgi:hypothetical protein